MKPYYQDNMTTLYLGDCREILPQLESLETVITDPLWPDTDVKIPGSDNPYQLFAEMCELLPLGIERLVIQLGCDSDPRFLRGIPSRWPFLRVCWLDYVQPSYKGRILYTGDVAYAYGIPPAYIKGRQIISGKCTSSRADKLFLRRTWKGSRYDRNCFTRDDEHTTPHPCARRLEHVLWLVHQFSDNAICDPFLGSGTTGVAAKKLGRQFIGIEIKEEYLELAIKRIRQQPLAVQEEMLMDSK